MSEFQFHETDYSVLDVGGRGRRMHELGLKLWKDAKARWDGCPPCDYEKARRDYRAAEKLVQPGAYPPASHV